MLKSTSCWTSSGMRGICTPRFCCSGGCFLKGQRIAKHNFKNKQMFKFLRSRPNKALVWALRCYPAATYAGGSSCSPWRRTRFPWVRSSCGCGCTGPCWCWLSTWCCPHEPTCCCPPEPWQHSSTRWWFCSTCQVQHHFLWPIYLWHHSFWLSWGRHQLGRSPNGAAWGCCFGCFKWKHCWARRGGHDRDSLDARILFLEYLFSIYSKRGLSFM